MADRPYDVTSDGHTPSGRPGGRPSHSASGKPLPWSGTQAPDDKLVQVRLPAGLVRRFDAWFAGQIPDARQRPAADPYRARVFEHGLAAFEKAFPPVQSLDARLAQLDAS